MRVIPPVAITDAMLTSSTVVETAPAAYAGGTTYALNDTASVAGAAGLLTIYRSLQADNIGHTPASSPTWWVDIGQTYQVYAGGTTYALADRVIDATNHLIYESAAAANTGHALTDTAWWLKVGPTNKWAIFDLLRNTQTTVPSTMTWALTPGRRVNSLFLGSMVANSATITVTSTVGGGVVYTRTENLNTREVINYYTWCFEPFSTRENLMLNDLPPFSDAVVTVTLTATTGTVSCGHCRIGTYEYLGRTQYGFESETLNFSEVTRDAYGNAAMEPGRDVPATTQKTLADKKYIDRIYDLRDALDGTTAVWSALDDLDTNGFFRAFLIVGYAKKFTIRPVSVNDAEISLDLEEV